MEFLFGLFLFISFIFLITFGAHFLSIRIELEKNGIKYIYKDFT